MFSRFTRSKDRPPDLRIALLGNSGSGKSASGNTILNRNRFRENHSLRALPRSCDTETAEVGSKDILVIDTPGLFETSVDEDKLIAEMKTCAHKSSPGLHAFLLVIRLDVSLTDEETNIMEWIKNFFGEDALRYTFILFTHANKLDNRSLDEFIRGRTDLQILVNSCGGDRYHAFNNRNRRNRDQVIELIEKIMISNNGGHHKTLQEFNKREKGRFYCKVAKVAGTATGIQRSSVLEEVGAQAAKSFTVGAESGGVVLEKEVWVELFPVVVVVAVVVVVVVVVVAAAVVKCQYRRTRQSRRHAHSN